MSALYTALAKAHAKLLLAPMDATNPAFRSRYASLESILKVLKPVLAENDLFVSQFPIGTNTLRTVVAHKSGEKIVTSFSMTPVSDKPHAVGSNYTYMKRYALLGIFAMVGDPDDDGNEASGQDGKAPQNGYKAPLNANKPMDLPPNQPMAIMSAAALSGWTMAQVLELIRQKLGKEGFTSLSEEEVQRVAKFIKSCKPEVLSKD